MGKNSSFTKTEIGVTAWSYASEKPPDPLPSCILGCRLACCISLSPVTWKSPVALRGPCSLGQLQALQRMCALWMARGRARSWPYSVNPIRWMRPRWHSVRLVPTGALWQPLGPAHLCLFSAEHQMSYWWSGVTCLWPPCYPQGKGINALQNIHGLFVVH